MIKILLPTDFSETANRSIDYVHHIFSNDELEVCFLHTYVSPDSTSGILINVLDIIKSDADKLMEEYLGESQKKYPNTTFTSKVLYGDLINHVKSLYEEDQFDYVVTGTNGASGVTELFIGSNTADLIAKGNFPLITVPNGASREDSSKLIVALDLQPIDIDVFNELVKIQKHTQFAIEFVTVTTNNKNSEEIITSYNLPFPDFKVTTIQDEDIETGLAKHMSTNKNSVLVIINRKRTFFNKLFHKSISKKLSMHNNTPMVILHG